MNEINYVFTPTVLTTGNKRIFRSEKFLVPGGTLTINLDFFNKDKIGAILIATSGLMGSDTLHFNYEFIIENKIQERNIDINGKSCLSCAKSKLRLPFDITFNDFCDENSGFLFGNSPKINCHLSLSLGKGCGSNPSYRSKIPTRNINIEKPNSSSRESTGFVGLANQGSTCYMNSYLQALFNLPAFRRLVYDLPTTGAENAETNIPLNLQTLFYQMQTSPKAVSTKQLTKSFGWTASDVFAQHDVEEFSRVLMDNLETKLKGTAFENSISTLFRGITKTVIKCKNVDFESSREEFFYDLNLDIAPTLQESFEKYLEKEQLTGDNQYSTDKYGKQDAEMGVELVELPPVLSLHLKRFQLDLRTFRNVKVDSKVEFPLVLDLSKYCPGCVYDLYGVLVHSGSAYGGHYFAYLRQLPDGKWNCFNDSSVYSADQKEAVEGNYGGNRGASGYYFIYVRHDEITEVFKPISDDEIPEHIKEAAKSTIESENRDFVEGSKSIDVVIQTEDSLIENAKNNKLGFLVESTPSNRIQIERSTKISELYTQISEKTSIKVDEMALWRTVGFGIPSTYIPNSDNLLSDIISSRLSILDIFVQRTTEKTEIGSNTITLFIKIFDPETAVVTYYGNKTVNESTKLIDMMKAIDEKLELGFEEIASSKTARILDPDCSIRENFISNGTIIVLQKKPTKIFEIPKTEIPSAFDLIPNLRDGFYSTFVDEMHNMATVRIRKYSDFSDVSLLRVPLTIKPPFLKFAIAKVAGISIYDPAKMGILIFTSDLFNPDTPSSKPLDNRQTLRSMISSQGSSLFFASVEFNDRINAGNLDSVRVFQIIVSEDGVNTSRHTVLLPLGSTPSDAMDVLGLHISPARCFEMFFKGAAFGDQIKMDDPVMHATMPVRIERAPEGPTEGLLLKVSFGVRTAGGQVRPVGDPFMVSCGGTMADLEHAVIEKAGPKFVDGSVIETVLPSHTFGKDVPLEAKVEELLTVFSELRIILPSAPAEEKAIETPIPCFSVFGKEKSVKIYN